MKCGAFLLSFFVIPLSFANDGIASKTVNGIIFTKTNDIQMKKEILTVSPEEISVKYIFKNTSTRPVTSLVAFPIPEFNCSWFGDSRTATAFETMVEGKKVNYKVEEKAIFTASDTKTKVYKDGEDVTKVLLRNKIPVDCRKLKLDDDLQKKLTKLNLGTFSLNDPEYYHWNTKITYYWNQTFPAGKEIEISHKYKPVYGRASGVDERCHNLFKKADAKHTPQGNMKWVNYILKTANTWKGPIESFDLIIKPGHRDNKIASNLGPLEKKGDEFILSKKNFSPIEDLFVCFDSRFQ